MLVSKVLKEVVVAYFKVLPHCSLGDTQEIKKIGYLVILPRFEQDMSCRI
jgi:hypothetical protein